MAANNTLTTAVKVTGLEQLQTLQSRIEGVSDKFSNLSSAIAGFALVNVVKNILGFADAVSDLSDATGVAIEDVLGFQKAVTAFGGTADGADKALLKLTQTLGEARSGNDQAKEAFMKLGFTLNDIATLEGKGLLIKTLEGLGNISDKAQQAALKAQLLTKDFRVVAIEGDNVANSFKTLSGQSVGSAAAIKNVADANQSLEKVFGDLKIAIAKVVSESGLADWIKSISANSQELEKYVKIAGIAFVTYFGAQTIVNLIKIAETIMGVTKAIVAMEVATSVAGGKVATLVSLLAKIGLAAALVTQASELNLGEDEQLKKIKQVENALKELSTEQRATFFALNADQQKQISNLIQLGKTAADAMKSVVKPAAGGKPASGDSGGGKPEESEATKSLKKNIEETVNAYKRLNEQRIASIGVQGQTVGKTADEAEMIKTLAEVSAKAKDEIDKLNVKKASLTKLQLAEGVGAVIDLQIKKIEAQEKADLKATEAAIQGLQTKKILEEDRLRTLENINKAIEDQEKRSQALGDVLKSANDKLIEVNFESSITGLSEVEKQIATINENNRKAALEAGRAFAAQFEGMDLTTAQSKELANGLEEISKKYKQISTAQIKAASESRTFGAGWKKALNEYVDNASNAAKRAESLFTKAFGGMEDLLVNFAKTGKFEWKGFVASMLEELLRSQIQMIFAQMMGGMKDSMGGLGSLFGGGGGGGGGGQQESGGGIMDAIGSIFGMGGGGQKGASANNPMYVVDVGSGGMGPMQQPGGGGLGGIWDSITGLFGGGPEQVGGPGTPESSSGGFFDTLTTGLGDFFSGFTGPQQLGGPQDSGGGIFDSLSGLFDGFFAGGGQIGAGKFGVVGENGPELVGGPASVSPMSGGSNVTFNINAVDAQSFKSMIAADQGFLYGVAMQGAKGIPMRG